MGVRARWAAILAVPLAMGLALPATAAAQDGPTITTQVVESHDGTPIVSTLFLPSDASDASPVPLVLRTHGWAGTGETEVGGTLEVLLDAGYAVMTWDQRGFGCSGGEVQVDKPEFEGRDASALIDWAVANAPIATEGGDPLVGFTGGSYAGGIQTATSSLDPRVDAIAPEISWADLRYSLYGGGVLNQGWAATLYAAGQPTASGQGLAPSCPGYADHGPQTGGLNPLISQGFAEGAATGTVSQDVLDFFAGSSLAHYGQTNPVAVPTLVLNGSVDTLFDLTDGWSIVEHVRAQGAPAKFVAFCGGHVACPASYADAGDRDHMNGAILTWFERYLRGDATVDTGAPVEYRTNEGQWRSADAYPPSSFGTLDATGEGTLTSVPGADSPHPDELAAYVEGLQGGGIPALPLTAAQPANEAELAAGQALRVEVAVAEGGPIEVVGIPDVEVTVTDGQGPEIVVFARLVDRESGEVLNLQEGGVRVALGEPTTMDVPMAGLAYTLPEGHHLDLELSTASTMHSNARTPAQATVAANLSLPADVPTAPTTGVGGDVVDGAPDGESRDDGGAGAPDGPQDAPPASVAPPTGTTTDAVPADSSAGPLPRTGGGTAVLGLGLLALAVSARSWSSARPRS